MTTALSFSILLGIIAGACFPIQAVINAKLRTFTKTPFMASFIAFSVGSIVLFLALIFFDSLFYQRIDFSYPPIIFVGGAIAGLIFNVANIVLFAKIGATITSLITIAGQMIMGTLLDHYGFLNLPINELSLTRAAGIALMIIAILLYQKTNLQSANTTISHSSKTKFWVILGVLVGIFPPLQAVFNGQLRLATDSILTSTFWSFFLGAILLAIIVLIAEKRIKIPTKDQNQQPIPLWVYSGGLFGIMIVGGTIVVIHQLGAILTSLLFIFGQLLMAVIVDHFGFLGLTKRRITLQKLIALTLMAIALFLV